MRVIFVRVTLVDIEPCSSQVRFSFLRICGFPRWVSPQLSRVQNGMPFRFTWNEHPQRWLRITGVFPAKTITRD